MEKEANKIYTPEGTVYNFHTILAKQKHLLIAGATGSGKSVIVNGIVYTLLHRMPMDVQNGAQFILIDPKRVELVDYRYCPHTIRYSSEPEAMIEALQYAIDLTELRYKQMQKEHAKLYDGSDVYVIIDEFADLMTVAAKRVTPIIQRLAQIGRAARVHIILCTQCPLAAVIPTKIKANFDSIVGLHTARAQDSRNILGVRGLEDLPQYGECFFMAPGYNEHWDVPMVSDDRIQAVIEYWRDEMKRIQSAKPKKERRKEIIVENAKEVVKGILGLTKFVFMIASIVLFGDTFFKIKK